MRVACMARGQVSFKSDLYPMLMSNVFLYMYTREHWVSRISDKIKLSLSSYPSYFCVPNPFNLPGKPCQMLSSQAPGLYFQCSSGKFVVPLTHIWRYIHMAHPHPIWSFPPVFCFLVPIVKGILPATGLTILQCILCKRNGNHGQIISQVSSIEIFNKSYHRWSSRW